MPERIPQSQTLRVSLKAYLASNHTTVATGKTIAVTLSKNGGAFGNPSGGATNATEIAQGWYYVDLTTTDTNTTGPLILRATQAQIDPVEIVYQVVNAHNAGFDALPNAAAEAAGGLYTRGSGAGQINQNANGQVDTRWIAGNVTVATNNDKTGYTVSTVSDKTGYSLTSAYDPAKTAAQAGDAMALTSGERTTLAAAIWAVLTSTFTTVGSIGKLFVDTLDAAVSSRSTYAGGDTSGVTTLLSRLTSGRAANLDNLDAAITSRSTYAGADTSGTTTLLSRLSGTRAGLLDNLDAAVSSRAITGDAMALTSAYDSAKTAAQAGDAMTLTSGERSSLAAAVWASGTRTLSSFGSLVSDIWAAVVDSSGVTTLLTRVTSTRAGNLDYLDATVSSRLPSSGTAGLVDDIWNEVLAGHSTTGTMGEALSIAAAGGGGGSVDLDAIKAKIVEALDEDLYDDIDQEDLESPTRLTYMIRWLYKLASNKTTQTASLTRVYNRIGARVDQKAAVSSDGTTFSRSGFSSGP